MNEQYIKKWRELVQNKVSPDKFYKKYLPDLYKGYKGWNICPICGQNTIKLDSINISCKNTDCSFGTLNILSLYGHLNKLNHADKYDKVEILNRICSDFKIDYQKMLLDEALLSIDKCIENQLYLQMYQMIKRMTLDDLLKYVQWSGDNKELSKLLWNLPYPNTSGTGKKKFRQFYTHMSLVRQYVLDEGRKYLDKYKTIIQYRQDNYHSMK